MFALTTSAVLLAAEEGAHVVNELPAPAVVYGVVMFVLLLISLTVTLSYSKRGLSPEAEPHHTDPADLSASELAALRQYSGAQHG